ncbi:MAG TPA: hypothetical protein VG271_10220, partial [Beijerinckiaceae bacterium]|nr:hypothetical protein [Beijerinckiaceae bacterium]
SLTSLICRACERTLPALGVSDIVSSSRAGGADKRDPLCILCTSAVCECCGVLQVFPTRLPEKLRLIAEPAGDGFYFSRFSD